MASPRARMYRFVPWMVRCLIPKGYIGSYQLFRREGERVDLVYVGRSDTDLQHRLLTHPYARKAHYFTYDVHWTKEQAFLVECANYHAATVQLLNKIHPAAPSNSPLKCPFCHFDIIRSMRNGGRPA